MTDHAIIVVGSGPAGVSVTLPIVMAGHTVLMLDVGHDAEKQVSIPGDFLELRQSSLHQAKFFYGEEAALMMAQKGQSPKLRSPNYQYVYRDFHRYYRVETENFKLTGSLAGGGLSNAWGAVCYTYSQEEIKLPPGEYQALRQSYQEIAARIGISGPAQDDLSLHFDPTIVVQAPLNLHPSCQHLLQNYKKKKNVKLTLGQPRSAVLTEDKEKRRACQYDNKCLWGCDTQSIYSASYDLARLRTFNNFHYKSKTFVQHIQKLAQGYRLICQMITTGETFTLTCHTLIVAAGTIGSTALVLDYTQSFNRVISLQSNPCVAMAYSLLKRLGKPITQKSFGMGQLAFQIEIPPANTAVSGTLYSAEVLLANELLSFMPLSRPGALSLNRYLTPTLLLMNAFMPGEYSQHSIELQKNKTTSCLKITGGYSEAYQKIASLFKKRMIIAMRKMGAFYLPMSYQQAIPGSDIHYAATMPMSDEHKPLTVNTQGQLYGEENFYVVDGAILPSLPAKNLTFTIMANADRIGKKLAVRDE